MRSISSVKDCEPDDSETRVRLSDLSDFTALRRLPTEPELLGPPSDADNDEAWLRLSSTKATHASGHNTALPVAHTTLSDTEFRDAIWHRVGLAAPVGHSACDPSPSEDPLGLPWLGCKSAALARLRRHNALASVVATCALKADPRAFQVEREVGLDGGSSRARPGDVSLDLGNVRTLLNITVVNLFIAARIRASRITGSPAVAEEEAFDKKVRKYGDLEQTPEDASHFVPLAVTAAGVWDERSIRWLRRFSAVCAASLGVDSGSAFADLMVRLAVALWRGTSAMSRSSFAEGSTVWPTPNKHECV